MQFLNLDNLNLEDKPTYDKARAVIVRADEKVSNAILKASGKISSFDDELLDDVFGPITFWTLAPSSSMAETIDQLFNNQKFPVIIGGSSFEVAQSFARHSTAISILAFDSQLDSWVARALNELAESIQFAAVMGNRSFSKDQWNFWKSNLDRLEIFDAKEKKTWEPMAILGSLKTNDMYLDINFSVFDPSIMPSSANPQPGGLFWNDVLNILRIIAQEKNIIGVNFTGLEPIENLTAPNILAAKLVLKTLIYKFKARDFDRAKRTPAPESPDM